MRILLKPGVIHSYCREQEISRDEMARRMGISTATAFRIDDGRTDPSPKFIASLMNLTGMPFEDLFEVVEPEQVSA
jgi:DNA-binding XRE family transcriptional regulator